jgi:hypothetical protein
MLKPPGDPESDMIAYTEAIFVFNRLKLTEDLNIADEVFQLKVDKENSNGQYSPEQCVHCKGVRINKHVLKRLITLYYTDLGSKGYS